MTSLYDAIKSFSRKLMDLPENTLELDGDSYNENIKLTDLSKQQMENLNDDEFGLFNILVYHYSNHIIDKTRYIDKLPMPTIREIFNKNEKHKSFTSKITYKTSKSRFNVINGKILISDEYDYNNKTFPAENGIWHQLCIELESQDDTPDLTVICYHDKYDKYDIHHSNPTSTWIGGPSLVAITNTEIHEYESLYDYCESYVFLPPCIQPNCLSHEVPRPEGIMIYFAEARNRSIELYGDRAFVIPTVWNPYPKLFSEELDNDFIDPFKDLPEFFQLGCDGNIDEINRLLEIGYCITRDDWNYCLLGAGRYHRKLDFIKFLVEHGADNFDTVLSGAFYDWDDIKIDMAEYAIANGAIHSDEDIRRACLGQNFHYIKYFLDNGGIKNWKEIFHYSDNICNDAINLLSEYGYNIDEQT